MPLRQILQYLLGMRTYNYLQKGFIKKRETRVNKIPIKTRSNWVQKEEISFDICLKEGDSQTCHRKVINKLLRQNEDQHDI